VLQTANTQVFPPAKSWSWAPWSSFSAMWSAACGKGSQAEGPSLECQRILPARQGTQSWLSGTGSFWRLVKFRG